MRPAAISARIVWSERIISGSTILLPGHVERAGQAWCGGGAGVVQRQNISFPS